MPFLHRACTHLTLLLASPGVLPACAMTASTAPDARPGWRLVHHETFDAPFAEPAAWTEDRYGPDSPAHVDVFDEDGAFFQARGGARFRDGLARFRSFRKSFRYGQDGWLTVELYGRDADGDGVPETGGRFTSERGQAQLRSTRHYDGAIIRSTEALPRRYRIEVTVSGIDFGGKRDGRWEHGGRVNGYDGDELAGPWRFTDTNPAPARAVTDNGVYFLCIVDYPRPMPHNNVFIHHHRKVVMDTDNNMDEWSRVWNPVLGRPERDGSHYVSMIWLDGSRFGDDWTGNEFVSYTPAGFQRGAVFVDKYLDGASYVFAIERDGERYTLSVTGRFQYGGQTTYTATRAFTASPPVWHYPQDAAELGPLPANEVRRYGDERYESWPAGVAYPDYFFFGDPHINYYEGQAAFDDLKLYLPAAPEASGTHHAMVAGGKTE